MLKYLVAAGLALAVSCPGVAAAQDCGCCESDPCVQTRKRLAWVDVTKTRCRLKRVCTVDECGCPQTKLVRVEECVTRKRLALVDVPVDPCRRGCFGRLKDHFAKCGSRDCQPDCCAPAPCGCGCGS